MSPAVPAVSILMPVYNTERYLAEALDDLLAQTFTDFELIAVDDGSVDGSPELLEAYAARDRRVVLLRNDVNVGLPRTLNRGLEQCSAPLVARADADDRYHPERLARQVAFMAAHPDVGLLSCASQRMTPDGEWLKVAHFPTSDGAIRMRELFVNCFSHPGVMFRTDLVRRLGGYDPDYTVAEDADLWARLRATTKAANLAEPLVYYRVLPTSLMRSMTGEQERRGPVVRQRLLSQYLDRHVDMPQARAMVATFHARRSAPASVQELRAGRAGLREVLCAARRKEDGETVAYFRREVALALLHHADFRRRSDPVTSWALLIDGLRWWPRLAVARRGVGQLRRCASSTAASALVRARQALPGRRHRKD